MIAIHPRMSASSDRDVATETRRRRLRFRDDGGNRMRTRRAMRGSVTTSPWEVERLETVDQPVRDLLDLAAFPLHHQHLKTVGFIEMDMKRGFDQPVRPMLQGRERFL